MDRLEKHLNTYERYIKDILTDLEELPIKKRNNLEKSSLDTFFMELSEERDILNSEKDNLNKYQKDKLRKLDRQLLKIYDHVKNTEFEELFLNWFSQYLPEPAHI